MKFGQLIEHNIRNIFVKNYTQNAIEILFPVPFLKKTKLSISMDQYSKVLFSLFLLYANQNILKLSCRPLAFTSYKAF